LLRTAHDKAGGKKNISSEETMRSQIAQLNTQIENGKKEEEQKPQSNGMYFPPGFFNRPVTTNLEGRAAGDW